MDKNAPETQTAKTVCWCLAALEVHESHENNIGVRTVHAVRDLELQVGMAAEHDLAQWLT